MPQNSDAMCGCACCLVVHHTFFCRCNCTRAADPSHDILRPYVAFHAALRSAYHSFIAHLEDNCKSLMRHHLEAATSEFAVTALAGTAWQLCRAGLSFIRPLLVSCGQSQSSWSTSCRACNSLPRLATTCRTVAAPTISYVISIIMCVS